MSSLTSSLWIWTGERNLLEVRKRVYHSVTRKDLVWFDTKTEDSSDLGAGGLMAKFARYVQMSLTRGLSKISLQGNGRGPDSHESCIRDAHSTSHHHYRLLGTGLLAIMGPHLGHSVRGTSINPHLNSRTRPRHAKIERRTSTYCCGVNACRPCYWRHQYSQSV